MSLRIRQFWTVNLQRKCSYKPFDWKGKDSLVFFPKVENDWHEHIVVEDEFACSRNNFLFDQTNIFADLKSCFHHITIHDLYFQNHYCIITEHMKWKWILSYF